MSVSRDEVMTRVLGIVADQLGKEYDEVAEVVGARTDIPLDLLGVDELEHFELMMNIEESFECEISDADAEGLLTLGALTDYLVECKERS